MGNRSKEIVLKKISSSKEIHTVYLRVSLIIPFFNKDKPLRLPGAAVQTPNRAPFFSRTTSVKTIKSLKHPYCIHLNLRMRESEKSEEFFNRNENTSKTSIMISINSDF